MKLRVLIVFCLIASLGGGGFYLLSSSGTRTPSIKERLTGSAAGKPSAPAENAGLAPDKKEKEKAKAPDGRTVVKGSLPPKLEKFNHELRSLATEIKEEKETLDRRASALPDNTEKMEKLITNSEELIARVNAANNIDSTLVREEYRRSLSRPVTSPRARAVMEGLGETDRELLEIERKLEGLAGDEDAGL